MVAQRILIYGVTGSGKTTLAAKLSEKTGIPWHSVDDMTWDANWTLLPSEVQEAKIRKICEKDSWILDTAYGAWIEAPLERAEVVIALDYPRWLSLGRLVRRTYRRIVDRSPVCNGNRETLRTALSHDSIVLWHFRSFASKRRRIHAWAADPTKPKVSIFRHPREIDTWLESLSRS